MRVKVKRVEEGWVLLAERSISGHLYQQARTAPAKKEDLRSAATSAIMPLTKLFSYKNARATLAGEPKTGGK